MEPFSSKYFQVPPSPPTKKKIQFFLSDTNEIEISEPRQESDSLLPKEQEIKTYTETMADFPDIRQERINEIQAAIEQGTYLVSAEDLANSLLKEISSQPPNSFSSSS